MEKLKFKDKGFKEAERLLPYVRRRMELKGFSDALKEVKDLFDWIETIIRGARKRLEREYCVGKCKGDNCEGCAIWSLIDLLEEYDYW